MQTIIQRHADLCNAYASAWAAPGLKDAGFLPRWRAAHQQYLDARTACPTCGEPTNPPPAPPA